MESLFWYIYRKANLDLRDLFFKIRKYNTKIYEFKKNLSSQKTN